MRTPIPWLAAISLVASLLPGCSSIDRMGDLENHSLAKKVSRKSDVVDAIGLPSSTKKDAGKGLEFWFYTGKPVNSSYFVPIPLASTTVSPGMSQVTYADLGAKNVSHNAPISLICVFDANGQLVDVYNPTSGKK